MICLILYFIWYLDSFLLFEFDFRVVLFSCRRRTCVELWTYYRWENTMLGRYLFITDGMLRNCLLYLWRKGKITCLLQLVLLWLRIEVIVPLRLLPWWCVISAWRKYMAMMQREWIVVIAFVITVSLFSLLKLYLSLFKIFVPLFIVHVQTLHFTFGVV